MKGRMKDEKGEDTEYFNAFGMNVKKDPFPATPPNKVNYWADNDEVFREIVKMVTDTLLFSSSSLQIFWGPLGGGKSFAAQYLENVSIEDAIQKQLGIMDKQMVTFVVRATRPIKAGQMISTIHSNIVSKLISYILNDSNLINELKRAHESMQQSELKDAFHDIASNIVKTVDNKISGTGVHSSEGYKYISMQKSKFGKIDDIYKMTLLVKVLIEVVLKKYHRIVIAIDELENLTVVTNTERLLVNDYLRGLYDENPNGFTLILIFTYDSFDDVRSVIDKSILSRSRGQVEFSYPKKEQIETYIKDCIELRAGLKLSDVMDPPVLQKIVKRMIDLFSTKIVFRDINTEMHSIFRNIYYYLGKPVKGARITEATFDKIYNGSINNDILYNLKKGKI